MSKIVDDIMKFREMLEPTSQTLNEHFFFDQPKKGGQARPPQDKLGKRPAQGVAKHPEDYKDMMTNPKMAHVKKTYAAGGPKTKLLEADKPVYRDHGFSNVEQAVRPIYQRVQGLVPSFADPVRSHLLQAQKALLAALEAAQNTNKNVEEADDSMNYYRQQSRQLEQLSLWYEKATNALDQRLESGEITKDEYQEIFGAIEQEYLEREEAIKYG